MKLATALTVLSCAVLPLLACDEGSGGDGVADAAPTTADAAAPVADAGPNQAPSAAIGNPSVGVSLVDRPLILRGSGTDADGNPLTFAWTQTAGPAVTLSAADVAAPAFIPRQVGTYTFSLVVSDGEDEAPPVAVTIHVHDIDGGEDFTLALKPDGTLLSWGDNSEGQLGDGSGLARTQPGPVCAPGAVDCVMNPFTGAVAIATGRSHALILKSDGTVWAFGQGFIGQIGNGNFEPAPTPVQVCDVGAVDCTANPLTGVVHIAAGYQFSVALKSDGTVVTWGQNSDGQLGDGTQTSLATPVKVCAPGQVAPCTVFLDDIAQLAAGGGGHTLALTTSGTLLGWGHNKSGQVGNGTSTSTLQAIPMPVCASGQTAPCAGSFTGAVAVDAWSGHSLALRADGTLWGWGSNDESELGLMSSEMCIGSSVCSTSPLQVSDLDDVATMAAGRRFSMALKADGTVHSWGDGFESQLGNGDVVVRTTAGPVCAVGQIAPCTAFLGDVGGLAAGSYHALALRHDGSLVSWGDDDFGQLGVGGVGGGLGVDSSVPVVVIGY